MIKSIFDIFTGSNSQTHSEKRLVQSNIERSVDIIDSRIRCIGSYKRQLKKPVELALDYSQHLTSSLHAPFELSRAAYPHDSRIKGVTASISHLREVLNSDNLLKTFFNNKAQKQDECYALLGITRKERQVLGHELGKNGDIRAEVAQTAISFTDHTFLVIAPSENALKLSISEYFFEILLHNARALRLSKKLECINALNGYQDISPEESLEISKNTLLQAKELLSIKNVKINMSEYGIKQPPNKATLRFELDESKHSNGTQPKVLIPVRIPKSEL